MAVQAGKDLLVKVDMTSDGQFESIAGLRATRISFNAETVDVTTLDSAGGWRELLVGAGVRSAAISGAGVFRDADTDARTRQLFFDGLTPDYRIVVPEFGTIQGPFQIASLEYAGTLNGEVTYELSLQSAGQLTFTAEVSQVVDDPAPEPEPEV
ncbi:MAG: phage major tail protein, TP901-1 family [Sulfitobacter sp.]|nr:phage major tail protein, TP901-1 family [Sulfitobacter sp.]